MAVRALAQCRGEGCQPETVTLSLQNRQSRDMVTSFSNIEITVDGEMQEWQDGTFREPNRPSVRSGEFIQIEIQPDLFRRMAQAQDVRMQLGGTRYRLVHNRRSTFRQMAAAMGLAG
jgi:archaellum component FlaG (FlaF/FlaG flagellin family)